MRLNSLAITKHRRAVWGLIAVLLAAGGAGTWLYSESTANRNQVTPASVDNAEPRLRAAVQAAPTDSAAHLALIRYLAAAGRYQDALDAAREARAALPTLPELRLRLAEALAATGRYPDAIATLAPVAKSDPEAAIRMAGYLMREGDRSRAAQIIAGLHEIPTSAKLRAGQVALDASRPDLALSLLRTAAALQPNNPDVLAHLGLALLMLGKYQEAIETFDRVVATGPETAAMHACLGSAIRMADQRDRLPEAAEHLRRATQLDPANALHQYDLGLALVQLRDWKGAGAALQRAAELKPDLAEVQRDLGRVLDRLGTADQAAIARSRYLRLVGDAAEAARELEPLVKSRPENIPLTLELGEAYYDDWQTPRTLTILHSLDARRPDDADVLGALYRGERAANHNGQALAALDRLLKITPDRVELLSDRADLLQRLGRYEELEKLLISLRDRAPHDPERHFQLGVVMTQWSARPDRMAVAEECFRAVTRLLPDRADGHHRLGLVLLATKRPAEAVEELRRALDRSPRMTDAARALARAYTLLKDPRAAEQFRYYRQLNAIDDEQRRLELPSSLHRATPAEQKALAQFYQRTGRMDSAVTELEGVLKKQPQDLEVRRTLASLYGHLRRFQRFYEERTSLRSIGDQESAK